MGSPRARLLGSRRDRRPRYCATVRPFVRTCPGEAAAGPQKDRRVMKLRVQDQVKEGCRISYDDGRPGHRGVEATVLALDGRGMTVQFDDRADTTYILFTDRRWMDFIAVVA